jgi:hypothetical protein
MAPPFRYRHTNGSSTTPDPAGRKELRSLGYVAESNDLVIATAGGLEAAGEVPPVPSTPAERLAL